MSLKLMTYSISINPGTSAMYMLEYSHILMLQVFEQLQLAISSLRQDRRAEGLHNLLHRDRLGRELILGRAVCCITWSTHVVPMLPLLCGGCLAVLTIPARRLPCPLVGDRCICPAVSLSIPTAAMHLL